MLIRPTTLPEACAALAVPGSVAVAGGTDVYPALVDRPMPARLVDLSRIAALQGISVSGERWRIGGATTWTEIASAELPPGLRCLQQAAREVGSVQIQNRASVAGNLCNASPAADGVPPLLALDARVELTGPEGVRNLAVGDFVLGNRKTARRPGEILSAVLIPRATDAAGSAFVKLGARRYLVISIVMVAATVRLDVAGRIVAASVAVGAASAVARRLPAVEARLVGVEAAALSSDIVAACDLAPLSPIDDVRATAAYRLEAAREIIGRCLQQAVEAGGHA